VLDVIYDLFEWFRTKFHETIPIVAIGLMAFAAWLEIIEWETFYQFLMYGAVWFILIMIALFGRGHSVGEKN
jgi:hypothetical protein